MLRVAIAGCHRQLLRQPGSHNFASAFCANPETVVAGVFDYGEKERAGFVECWREVWGEVPAFDDYGRLLDEVRPDIVCIATRQTLHADQIEQAVAAGARGILCDKPLVTSLAELDRVAAACESTPLAFALDRRWNPAYHALRSALAAHPIGEITSISAYGIPNTINHGCHWYDAMLMLLGDPEPAWVSGFLDPWRSARRAPPQRSSLPGADRPGQRSPRLRHLRRAEGPRLRDRRRGRADLRVRRRGGAARIHGDASEEPIPLPPKAEGWPAGTGMVADLVRAVKEGGRTACDVPQARRATEIGFAIWSSSQRDGARVRLPADDRGLRVESYPWGNEAPT